MKKKKTVVYERVERLPELVEPVGILPRSIFRACSRMIEAMFHRTSQLVIEEYRISRYQMFVSVEVVLSFLFYPLIVQGLSLDFLLRPGLTSIWNQSQPDVFLNTHFQHEAALELTAFEDELFFEYMLDPEQKSLPSSNKKPSGQNWSLPQALENRLSLRTKVLAEDYNTQSIEALSVFGADTLYACTWVYLIATMRAKLIIFKGVALELFFSVTDTQRGVFLLFTSNLLVGFHSPPGWELLLHKVFERYGWPPEETIIFIFVSSFPVILATVFKYWVFRYLNKMSPSTVVTYHALIE